MDTTNASTLSFHKKRILLKVWTAILFCGLCWGAGGPELVNAQTQISDWHDLNDIRNNLDGDYILVNNLDENTAGYADVAAPIADDGNGWIPVGNFAGPFTGIFDGNEHAVNGLTINRPGENEIGLFGRLGSGSEITGLALQDIDITGQNYVGGLAGVNQGSIVECSATGSITGSGRVGGLLGHNNFGTVADSYNTSLVEGEIRVGGLAGENEGIITNTYSIGSVTGDGSVGGLLGSNSFGTVNDSYWNTETSGLENNGTGEGGSGGITGLTTFQIRNQSNFNNWDFEETWNIVNGAFFPLNKDFIPDEVPGLRFTGGIGSEEDPFQISTLEHLQAVKDFLSSAFILNNDLDASDTQSWNDGKGFEPIGDAENPFTGSLDGNSHAVTGLTISRPDEDDIGLFGGLDNGAEIIRLTLDEVNVTGQNQVGGLAGIYNDGTITQSYVTGSVSGEINVGGLAGKITNGIITQSYTTAGVNGDDRVGGLIGMQEGGTVTYSYAAGSVTGNTNTAGLVSENNGGSVTNSYWNIETTGQSDSDGGIGLNNIQMRTETTFTGWDFTDTWQIGEAPDHSYPWLQNLPQNPPPGYQEGFIAGGDGTEANPYQILTIDELQLMKNYLESHFILITDIDASATQTWNQGKGFEPIGKAGSSDNYFTGSLDGNGHKITGLTINRPDEDKIGLFGASSYSAKITHVGLEEANVVGQNYVGVLAGDVRHPITDCYATGRVEGVEDVGGLVGAGSVIINSNASVRVIGTSNVGGLIGYLSLDDSELTNTYAAGNIEGDENVGGLIGEGDIYGGLNPDEQTILKGNYATGDVTSTGNKVGGLAGLLRTENEVIVNQNYATGNVTGNVEVGGLIGEYKMLLGSPVHKEVVTQNFATGNITGKVSTAALIGDLDISPPPDLVVFKNNYWNVEISGQSKVVDNLRNSDFDETFIDTSFTGLTTVQMIEESSFSEFDFDDIWSIDEGVSYPYLQSNTPDELPKPFPDGEGSVSNPYQIENIGQLQAMNIFYDSHFTLAGNIDATATVNWNKDGEDVLGFKPVGNSDTPFSGSLNGNGYTINGLTINRGSTDDVGLFGRLSGAIIDQVGLTNVEIIGSSNTGALAGQTTNAAKISNSFTTGSVTGETGVGGLAGTNKSSSEITNSYSTADVDGNDSIGGLAGSNAALITKSYSSGSVGNQSNSGGLAGMNSGTITDSYWNTQTSGQSSSGGGTGLTTNQMRSAGSFSGWDFSSIWQIEESDSYPYLRNTPQDPVPGLDINSLPGYSYSLLLDGTDD